MKLEIKQNSIRVTLVGGSRLRVLFKEAEQFMAGKFLMIHNVDDWQDFRQTLKHNRPDIIIFSTSFSSENILETLSVLPAAKFIQLSDEDFTSGMLHIFRSGVRSFVRWSEGVCELSKALQAVNGGGVYLTEHVASKVVRFCPKKEEQISNFTLTKIERCILRYLNMGYSSKSIAEMIFKSPRTVEKYRQELYYKFSVSNTIQLLNASRILLIDDGDNAS